jgi:hydroxyethylthiazole kinase-like uncharacterized protein yjeF
MRIVDTAEMRDLEQTSKSKFNYDERLIIENVAVKGSAVIYEDVIQSIEYPEIIFLIGAGNNGADGVAIARHLTTMGQRVRAFTLFPEEEMKDELKYQLNMAKSFGVAVNQIEEVVQLLEYFNQSGGNIVVVDAIFGTGVQMPLPNFFYDVIKAVNENANYTISIDLPSGVEGDSGFIQGNAINADMTLAVGLPKLGYYVADGSKLVGDVRVLDVGFPFEVMQSGNKHLLGLEDIIDTAQKRNKFGDKKIFGHTLVIGGSHGLTGALVMASQAALKVGAGLITAATWEPQYQEFIARLIPEVMTGYVPLDTAKWPRLIKDLNKYSAIVIGPGLARSTRARKLVIEVLNNFSGPVVLDADAINVMSLKEDGNVFAMRNAPTVLTPHFGEFANFAGIEYDELDRRPVYYLQKLVDQINCSVILKGPCTYMGFPDGNIFFNYFPNDGMATGGVGDVLAGILGGLLGQDQELKEKKQSLTQRYDNFNKSVCMAVYIHSLAGKHAAEEYGVRAMTAMSLIDSFSGAFKELNTNIDRIVMGGY